MALGKRGHALNFLGTAGLLVIMTWSWFDQAMMWIPLALAGTRLGLRPAPPGNGSPRPTAGSTGRSAA